MNHLATLALAILCTVPVCAETATQPPPAPTVPADAGEVCIQLMERQHRLIRSIAGTADADAATAELQVLGEIMMGLLSTPDALQLTDAQQQHLHSLMADILACSKELSAKHFYDSRLMMTAYGSMMPGTLEPPTEAEKAACTERIRREFESVSHLLPTIIDRQSADDAAIALLSLNKLVNLAWEAELVSDELITELMKPKDATAEDRAEINRLKAADFYGSHLLLMSLGL